MQIVSISIYGHNKKRRDVEFKLSSLNILSGSSGTGKSTLIDIIDYCFGSDCKIAKGLIRNHVAWYSIVLSFSDCEVFIARKAPKKGLDSNSICDLRISKNITIPKFEELEESTNLDSVLGFLTEKIGIGEYKTEVPEQHTRSSFDVKFRHTLPYVLQAQDEIASRNILFHKQSDHWVEVAIKDTFSYIIGATEESRLKDIKQLRELKRERSKIQKQIRENEYIRGQGLRKGYQLLAEASNLGLTDRVIEVDDECLLSILHGLRTWKPREISDSMSDDDPLASLNAQKDLLVQEKRELRLQIQNTTDYQSEIEAVGHEFDEQLNRLKTINLFKSIHFSDNNSNNRINLVRRAIQTNAKRLSSELEGVTRIKPKVSAFVSVLKQKDRDLANKLFNIRTSIDSLLKERGEYEKSVSEENRRHQVIGRISFYLESLDDKADTSLLNNKLATIEPRIIKLEEHLNPQKMRDKLEAQLNIIARDMTKWAEELNLEHSEHIIRLDPVKLTVVADTPDGRVPLNQMGSGENWVGYHLVTLLALAKWFITENRPVPNFLFLDQPTQVFFPADSEGKKDLDAELKDEDREKVKRMFKLIDSVVNSLNLNLQVIVTDHADLTESWFQESVITPKWRGGEALIPIDWLEDKSGQQVN
ncbi:uncharacterized protein DUF3732 [Vibrio crassostreae]|uniref:DUF3732 domain-containing protein n=1 Tax=Vibrio crassostreae TaxID=246167 RepID=UPI000F48B6FB|nr:DUF3732 domain-containing protein [Vibrio crassostreae]ROR70440.1 uncharacterized protein DUF3732 [Vibrio crassostreae]